MKIGSRTRRPRPVIRPLTAAIVLSAISLASPVAPPVLAAPAGGRHVSAPSASDLSLVASLRKQAGGRLGKFYAARGYRPLWVSQGRIGKTAQVFLKDLDEADLDGLKSSRYGPAALRKAIVAADRGGVGELAAAELAFSRAFVRYVRDMRKLRDVGMTFVGAGLKPPRLEDDAMLRVAAARDFDRYVATMGWMSPHYAMMRDLLGKAEKEGADEATLDVIRLNRERARVLPSPSVRHIVVDAATARLWYYQDGELAGSMKVVVGAAATQTPMLAGWVNWAIFNPYWNVPDYLTRDNVAKKILSGRTLASMHMQVLSDWSANPQVVDPGTVDWKAVAEGRQDVRVRELPGPYNSMGKVKFLFPNDDGIYLHDTPNRDLLAKAGRHFSNGCIRLDNADALGKWMMGKAYRSPGKEAEVPVALPAPVPVYLTYLTVASTRKGVALLDDVYGRDGRSPSAPGSGKVAAR